MTAAANVLNTSLPTITRTIAALENSLGIRLFNRTTRRLHLTEEGEHYLLRCKSAMAELDDAEVALSSRQLQPSGKLRVTAPVLFGRLYVNPLLNQFVADHHAVSSELLLLDRVVDLVEDGIDVGIRIAHLADSSLIGRQVGEVRRVVCASPDYLQQAELPRTPGDLANHHIVQVSNQTTGREWQFRQKQDQYKTKRINGITVNARITCNQIDAAIDACRSGFGLGWFLSYQVQPWIASGELVTVLRDFELAPVPVNVVYPHARLLSTRARVFTDWLCPRLRENLLP